MEQYIVKNQKKLRFGITTGTCAAAAARAAASHLLLGDGGSMESVTIHTPKGVTVNVPVRQVLHTETACEYSVIKDSGDDPDVTNGAEVFARIERVDDVLRKKTGQTENAPSFHSEDYPNLYLDGGEGIGRVTKEGLEQAIGQAAINPVPRSMIFQAVGNVCESVGYEETLRITVSIPAGVELAKQTFNPRLGIEGGISVLGTSGILEPMSERAIVDTIEMQIRQMAGQGRKQILVTPGNYGQAYASDYLKLDLEQSIKCSNYIGETIDLAIAYGMEQFLLVGNIGKLVKLAAGIMNTHSKVADGRCEIFAVHTILSGGTREMAQILMNCINTDEMLSYLEEWQLRQPVMERICGKIEESMTRRIGGKMQAGAVLFSEKYGYLGETSGVRSLLKAYHGSTGAS